MKALELDYTEMVLVSIGHRRIAAETSRSADALASDPADAERFAGAIENMRTMAAWHLEIARKADAARGVEEPSVEEVAPRCDICGMTERAGGLDYASGEADWNGETGNHASCEAIPETELRALAGDR